MENKSKIKNFILNFLANKQEICEIMEDIEKMYEGFATDEDREQLMALEQRLAKNPNDFDALLQKAILYYDPFVLTEESIVIFRSIIAQDPKNVDAYFWLAKCLWQYHRDYLEAERLLRIALSIDPNRADCHLWLAIILEGVIERHLRKAIELEPTWIGPRKSLAYHFFKEGKLKFAKNEVLEALKYVIKNDDVPQIKNAITEHYETLVTGRYYPKEVKEKLLNFLKRIELAIEHKKIAQKVLYNIDPSNENED